MWRRPLVEAFVEAASLWSATSPRNLLAPRIGTALTGTTEREDALEQERFLKEWEARQPEAVGVPASSLPYEVEEISLEAFLSGMRGVEHTRRRCVMCYWCGSVLY